MDRVALPLPPGDQGLPRLDRLRREVLDLEPSERRGVHRDREDRVARPAHGRERVARRIELGLALGVEDLHPQAHGVDGVREAPEVPQRAVRPPEAAVVLPDVAVLHEDGADARQREVAGAPPRRDVEVDGDAAARPVHQPVHQHPLALERERGRRVHRVELEVVDAERAVEGQEEVGVPPPVRRLVGGVRPEPQPELHALRARLLDERREPAREPDGVDVPEARLLPPGAPAPLFAPRDADGIGRVALLPAVVDLDHVHAELGPRRDLAPQEALVDAGVLVPVAPGVGEEEPVPARDVRTERPVEVRGGADAPRPPAAIADAEAPVGAGKDAQHLPPGIHVPVGRIVRPRVRQRRLAEEGDALPAERILEEERRSGNVERPLAAGEKTLLLEIQVVVPVRVVHQLDLDQPRMLPRIAELAAFLRSVRKRTDLGCDGIRH